MDGHRRQGDKGVTDQRLEQSGPVGTSAQSWSQRAAGRSNCYGLLALVFRDAPTSQTVE
ncbi:hypothetical protein LCGC14_1999580, partial [marine sediment metagenome]